MIATIDFETTGLKAGEDEVLQVSIIDENYNVLLNVYCRPNNKGSWEDAQAVHGITPLMVANELPFERVVTSGRALPSVQHTTVTSLRLTIP